MKRTHAFPVAGPPEGTLVSAWVDAHVHLDKTDTVAASHCWPHFGKNEVRNYLTLQRDNYKYLHDQTVRLMKLNEFGKKRDKLFKMVLY